MTLALYRRTGTPGETLGDPLGAQVGGGARGPAGTVRVRVPPGINPSALWLVARTDDGLGAALVAPAGVAVNEAAREVAACAAAFAVLALLLPLPRLRSEGQRAGALAVLLSPPGPCCSGRWCPRTTPATGSTASPRPCRRGGGGRGRDRRGRRARRAASA